PVGLLPVDEVADDVERAPRLRALVRTRPGLRQTREERPQDAGRALQDRRAVSKIEVQIESPAPDPIPRLGSARSRGARKASRPGARRRGRAPASRTRRRAAAVPPPRPTTRASPPERSRGGPTRCGPAARRRGAASRAP